MSGDVSFTEVSGQEDQTEFNSAIATLMRIDAIKKKLIIDTMHEKYYEHFLDLSALYKELVSMLNDKEEETQQDNFILHKKNFRELKEIRRLGRSSIPLKLVEWLDTWEIELKNLEQKHGMNMPKKGDPRYALAGRR